MLEELMISESYLQKVFGPGQTTYWILKLRLLLLCFILNNL
jgi:hypothetical protein